MAHETLTPHAAGNLLALTAEHVEGFSDTHVCDSLQVFWSDVQETPLATLYMATRDKTIVEPGQRPVTELLTFTEGKLFINTSYGGIPLLRRKERPKAAEAIRALGGVVAGMTVEYPAGIFLAGVSGADAYSTADTKLTIEAVAPSNAVEAAQLSNMLQSFPTHAERYPNAYAFPLPHQELGRPPRTYAADFFVYPLHKAEAEQA